MLNASIAFSWCQGKPPAVAAVGRLASRGKASCAVESIFILSVIFPSLFESMFILSVLFFHHFLKTLRQASPATAAGKRTPRGQATSICIHPITD